MVYIYANTTDPNAFARANANLLPLGLSDNHLLNPIGYNSQTQGYDFGSTLILPAGLEDGVVEVNTSVTDTTGNTAGAILQVRIDNTIPLFSVEPEPYAEVLGWGSELLLSGVFDGTGSDLKLYRITQQELDASGNEIDGPFNYPVQQQVPGFTNLSNGSYTHIPFTLLTPNGLPNFNVNSTHLRLTFSVADGAGNIVHKSIVVPIQPGIPSEEPPTVLFLPGIQGSRLYRPSVDGAHETTLWEPSANEDVRDLSLNSDGTSVRGDIYTKRGDVIDEVAIGGTNIYKSFIEEMDAMKASREISDWSPVAYDWRLSVEDILNYGHEIDGKIYYSGPERATSTPYVLQELRRLAAKGKVTIVAHSNGGLVAKLLLKQLEETNDPVLARVDKLILVASPQTGTPLAVGALLHGVDQGYQPVLKAETARHFAKNAPMAYNLIPSEAYFDGTGSGVETPVVHFVPSTETAIFTGAYGTQIDSALELAPFVVGSEGRTEPALDNLTYPQGGNAFLQQEANELHEQIDNWSPPTTLKVYQIAGWGLDTISSFTYKKGGFFHCFLKNPCLDMDLSMVEDGDGVVVTPSAHAIGEDYSNVEHLWLDMDQFNKEQLFALDHASILELQELREFIKGILEDSILLPRYITNNRPDGDNSKKLRFYLHSPLNVHLYNDDGRHLGYSDSGDTIEKEIPGSQYQEFGDITFVSVPAKVGVKLVLKGKASGGFSLKIEEADGGEIITETRFLDVQSSTSTIATMQFTDGTLGGASDLAIDVDGNGVAEYQLPVRINGEVTPYIWEGFSQPINDMVYYANTPKSVFKAGSTVPVKFQIRNTAGDVVQSIATPLWLAPQKGSAMSAPIDEPVYSIAASAGTSYRWDATSGQYIYNWSTKGLSPGFWYRIFAKLDDGTIRSVTVGLK